MIDQFVGFPWTVQAGLLNEISNLVEQQKLPQKIHTRALPSALMVLVVLFIKISTSHWSNIEISTLLVISISSIVSCL